jgi:hypothetical protein
MPLSCRVLGHRPRFWAEGTTLHWRCERDCDDPGGTREYASAADARRIAAALDVEDRDGIGDRAILSLMPLKLARRGK